MIETVFKRRVSQWAGAGVIALSLGAAPAHAQLAEVQEFASASADLAEILTDKEVITDVKSVAKLEKVTKVMGTMGATMALAGAAFEIIMMFDEDNKSEHEQVMEQLEKLDTKIVRISAQIESSFAKLDEKDDYREARRDLYESSREIENAYADWIVHQRQMSEWRSNPRRNIDTMPTFDTKNQDMDITAFARNIGRLCVGGFLSEPLFPLVEKRTYGNIGEVGKWGAWIFTRLSEAQQVATFILTEQRYKAALGRRGDISESEKAKLMKDMAEAAAKEVHDSYEEPWEQCHDAMSASLDRLSSPKVIKAYAEKIIEEAMYTTSGEVNAGFFRKGATAIGELLEKNFPTTSWVAIQYSGRYYGEKFGKYAKRYYHSSPGGRTVRWKDIPVPTGGSAGTMYTSLYLHFFFDDEKPDDVGQTLSPAIQALAITHRITDTVIASPKKALEPLKGYSGFKWMVAGEMFNYQFYLSRQPKKVKFWQETVGKKGTWFLYSP